MSRRRPHVVWQHGPTICHACDTLHNAGLPAIHIGHQRLPVCRDCRHVLRRALAEHDTHPQEATA